MSKQGKGHSAWITHVKPLTSPNFVSSFLLIFAFAIYACFSPFFWRGGGGRILVSKQVAKVRCWEGYFQSNPPLHIRELGFLVHLVTQHILCDQMFILDGLSAEVGGREKAKKDCRVRNYAATAFSKFFTAMRCAVVEIWLNWKYIKELEL